MHKSIFFNECIAPIHVDADLSLVQQFHSQLPGYTETPLVSLDDVAKALNVKSVFLKDEGNRVGLPAFKILGASWGTCRAIISQTGIHTDSSLGDISQAAKKNCTVLFTASAGNHGRALAAMARILGIPARIYLPRTANEEAIRLISSEGANVTVSKHNYDGAVMEAFKEAEVTKGGLFVQDAAFDGYEKIPNWIVEGYATLLYEVEQQLERKSLKASLIITPVGVGSLAHAVVRHCKSDNRQCAVMSVEPNTAPCLHESLIAGKLVSVQTTKTIMEGMNCGTVSSTAFKDLQCGIDASTTVSDFESHKAMQYLAESSIRSGPCGGAALAGLWKLADYPERPSWLSGDAIIVILSTEGPRQYDIPLPDASAVESTSIES